MPKDRRRRRFIVKNGDTFIVENGDTYIHCRQWRYTHYRIESCPFAF